jgi:hypothetical protein
MATVSLKADVGEAMPFDRGSINAALGVPAQRH